MMQEQVSGVAAKRLFTVIALLAGGLASLEAIAQTASVTRTSLTEPTAVEDLLELDEVIVHGTNLRNRIVRAEDKFYKLYNQLNKDDDYDINCAYISLEQDTRIQDRLCTPSFFANAIVETMQWNERCRGTQDSEGNYVPPPPCYTPPPPELVLLDRSDELAKNIMSVIRSDPGLGDMAGELDDLHRERARLANRYVELQSAEKEIRAAQPRYRPKIR